MKYKNEIQIIKDGGVGVIPTDTLYGLVSSALLPDSVKKVYKLKNRSDDKPLIVLISKKEDLEKFGIEVDRKLEKVFEKYWPGPVSIILECEDNFFSYIHKGTNSIAFRLPDLDWLREFINQTGPLVAPSANLEGISPAKNIDEAKDCFSNNVDFYIDGGELNGNPSKIIRISDGDEEFIR